MLTLLKWLAGFLATLASLILIAIVVLPQVIDPNDYRNQIAQQVKNQTGRNLHLDGDLSVSVFPWLGIRTQALRLSQPEQIGGNMVSVDTAQIRVKMLPLLSRRIEVDTVVLEAPRVRIVTLKDGTDSFYGLIESNEPADNDDSIDRAAVGAVVIQGLALADGHLIYDNQQEGQRTEVTNLNLVTGNLIGGELADIKASGVLLDSSSSDSTVFNLTAEAQIDTGPLSLLVENLTAQIIQGELSALINFDALTMLQNQDIKITNLKGVLEAEQDLRFTMNSVMLNLASQHATVPELMLTMGGASAVVSELSASHIIDDLRLSGLVNVEPFNAATLVRAFSLDFEPTDSQALTSVAATADFKAGLNSIDLNNLELMVDKSQLTGSTSIEDFENPKIIFDLSLDQLNLDRYLPVSEVGSDDEISSAEALVVPMAIFQDVFANGSFKAGQLISGGLELNDIDVTVVSTPGNVTITPTANLYEGKLGGAIAYKKVGETAELRVKNKMDLVSLGKLLNAAEITDQLSGIGSLDIDMLITERDGVQSNQGTIKLLAKNGIVKGVDIKAIVDQGYAKYQELRGRTDEHSQEQDEAKQMEQGEGKQSDETRFAELLGTFRLKNNKLTNQDFAVKAPLFRIGGEGDIDVARQTLDYLLNVSVVNSTDGQGGESLEKLKGITLPIRLSGDLTAPDFALDMKALYKFFVKSEIDEKKGEYLQEKLGIEGGSELSSKEIFKQLLLNELTKKDKQGVSSNEEPPVYDPQSSADQGTTAENGVPVYGPQSSDDQRAPEVSANPNQATPEEGSGTGKETLRDELKRRLLEELFKEE